MTDLTDIMPFIFVGANISNLSFIDLKSACPSYGNALWIKGINRVSIHDNVHLDILSQCNRWQKQIFELIAFLDYFLLTANANLSHQQSTTTTLLLFVRNPTHHLDSLRRHLSLLLLLLLLHTFTNIKFDVKAIIYAAIQDKVEAPHSWNQTK